MDWRQQLDAAAAALREQRHRDALQHCDKAAQQGDTARYHAAKLRGDVLLDLGDAAGALSSYDTAADPATADPMIDCGRGIALFQLGRLPEAEKALQSALRDRPDLAEAYYALGIIAEIYGNEAATAYFRQARRLDPERFPATLRLSRAEFEQVLQKAIERLSPEEQRFLASVRVLVADVPDAIHLHDERLAITPSSTGIYLPPRLGSTVVAEAEPGDAFFLLYKRNLERAAGDREALVDVILGTLVHEVQQAQG